MTNVWSLLERRGLNFKLTFGFVALIVIFLIQGLINLASQRALVKDLRQLYEIELLGISNAKDALIDYTQALVSHTRQSPDYQVGLSPRAALALLSAARAWSLLEGRDHVLPEDIQLVLPAVAPHRLRPAGDALLRLNAAQITAHLIEAVPLP